jgi:type IV secretion system protein VirB1
VRTESGGNPLLLHVNGGSQPSPAPQTKEEVVSLASRFIAEGKSVDLGLMQINSDNLEWLGMSIEDTFDPCKNLAAGSRILEENYQRAHRQKGQEQVALYAALSAYNTGNQTAGIKNGYVQKVVENSTYKVPAISAVAEIKPEPAPEWDVFGGEEVADTHWDAFSSTNKEEGPIENRVNN